MDRDTRSRRVFGPLGLGALLLFGGSNSFAERTSHSTPKQLAIASAPEAAARVRSLYFSDDYDGVLAEGKALAERFPESTELSAWYLASAALRWPEDEAIREAERLTSEKPADPWSWFALAATLRFARDRHADPLKVGRKALAMAPNHPDFLWLRAFLLESKGDSRAAIEFVDQVKDRVSNPAELLVVRADELRFIGQRGATMRPPGPLVQDAALREYEKARSADPDCVHAYSHAAQYLLGWVHRERQAVPLVERALKLAPCSLTVHRLSWRVIHSLKELDKRDRETRIDSDIQRLVECRGTAPMVLASVAEEYESLGMKEKQKRFENRVLREHPDSQAAEQVLAARWGAIGRKGAEEGKKEPQDQLAYRKMLTDFIQRPQHRQQAYLGEAYMDLFFSMKDDPTVRDEDFFKAVEGMAEHERYNLHISTVAGPIALAERRIHLDRAEAIVLKGIDRFEEEAKDRGKGSGYEPAEWKEYARYQKALFQDALGWIHLRQGRVQEAAKELKRAAKISHPIVENAYHLGMLWETRGDLDRAEDSYAKGVAIQSPGDNPCEQALRDLYTKRTGSAQGYEQYAARLREKSSVQRRERILAERQANPSPLSPFDLRTLDGRRVKASVLQGKIAVINFWGLWCGWCLKEMPDFQKLHEKYRNDPQVVILTIDNDPDPAKVKEWMKTRKFDFPVLLDDGYVSKEGVSGFPTTWFVDPQGRKAFIMDGWTKELVEEYGWRIEALRKATS
ncbi:MAG: hypothetical protein DMH00_04215 [Acidobacteria bacterium]|nr:MAG: hypothetical protein DMH00_04215 [Acidobacteriota bacterium]